MRTPGLPEKLSFARLGGQPGFTLIELVIAIILIGLLGAVGVTMISDSFDTTRMINANQSTVAQARYAMERMQREIREAKTVSSYSGTGISFTKPDATSVDITSGSGNLAVNNATLLAGLLINNPPAGSPKPLLAYYKSDGVTPADAATNIRFVEITLTVTDSTSGQSLTQRSRVSLRNAG